MSTINASMVISAVNKRYKTQLLSITDAYADIELYTDSTIRLERGDDITIAPKRLFAAYTNDINILIHITVNGDTVVLPCKSWIYLPFSTDDTVSIKLENPDEPSSLPAVVSYLTV